MESFFAKLSVVDMRGDIHRNIVSLRTSVDLFDDLSDDPDEQLLAQTVENPTKPYPFRSLTPAIHRPFEEAEWFNAIGWPFKHWQSSRYSDGSFGVWYGGDSVETTVFETAYHWYTGLLSDAEGFVREKVAIERKVYNVNCEALLLNLRPRAAGYPALVHKTDYGFTQQVGARLHREGHPGFMVPSVRYPQGVSHVVLNPAVLSNPRANCLLTYRLDGKHVLVERRPGVTWRRLSIAEF